MNALKLDKRESEDGTTSVKQERVCVCRGVSMPEPGGERKRGEESKKMAFSISKSPGANGVYP